MNAFIKLFKSFVVLTGITLAIAQQAESQVAMSKGSNRSILAPDATVSSGFLDLPFTESWDQGNFSYHHWTFSSTDNNWSVDTAYGNPAPCADFFAQPYRINYSQAMTSDTIDATAFTCADIWLDFDLRVIIYNPTGNEKMTVEVLRNGIWTPRMEFSNQVTTSWQPSHISLDSLQGTFFQVRFVVHGINSADVLHWHLDNIHIYGDCHGPVNLHGNSGQGRKMYLAWQPPDCSLVPGYMTTMVLDDGTWENGWNMPPGILGWFGNEFSVSPFTSGEIRAVNLYFVDNGNGSQQTLSLDIYDQNYVLIGSSAPFTTVLDAWMTVPVNNILFNSSFYVMVKFNVPGMSYFLASDENGPNAAQDLAWYRSSTGVWQHASSLGSQPCVFLQRVKAFMIGDMTSPPDSSQQTGYNVYRSALGGIPPFTKRNTTLLSALSYVDTLPPGTPWYSHWDYYTTMVYRNSADSTILCEGSSDILNVLYVGTGEHAQPQNTIFPNPATDRVKITSGSPVSSVEVFDILGRNVYTALKANDLSLDIETKTFSRGVYYFKVTTPGDTWIEKVVVAD